MTRFVIAWFSALLWIFAMPASAQVQRNFLATRCAARSSSSIRRRSRSTAWRRSFRPGARIRGANNMLLMSATLWPEAARPLHARPAGALHDVWILARTRRRAGPGPRRRARPGLALRRHDADLVQAMSGAPPAEEGLHQDLRLPDERVRLGPDVRRARGGRGYAPTDDVEEADLILFNTCSVREKAQEKVFSDLGRVKHLRRAAR